MEKPFDLEIRTFLFAKSVRNLVYSFKKSIANIEDGKQLVRSSGSVAANYIESNEHISDKDFNIEHSTSLIELINEADELKKIFSAIVQKRKSR